MDMALARADNRPLRFYSMSRQIAAELKSYYGLLEEMGKGDLEITPWLLWFVGCLSRSIHTAMHSTSIVLEKARFWERADPLTLSARQRKVLAKLLDDFQGKLTSDKYRKIASISKETAIRDINELIALGVLVKEDSGSRSTSYVLAPGWFNRPMPASDVA